MAQKFIGLDDAAKQLGATKEQLNSLREAGELRGYRDGTSWKFRADEIDALGEKGLSGAADAGSSDSLSLDSLAEGLESDSLDFSEELSIDFGDDAELGDSKSDAQAEPDTPAPAPSPESDLELSFDDEPTLPADEDENTSLADDEADSILLTDDAVGGSPDRPPSTIIGKSELASGEDDLQLASDSDIAPGASDVKLASDDKDDLSGLSALGAGESGGSSPEEAAAQFEGLEELEIDLEAESSRILEADDVKAAQAAAAKQQEEAAKQSRSALDSDLALMAGSDAASLTGLSALGGEEGDSFELAADSSPSNAPVVGDDDISVEKGPGSSAVLSDDKEDDFVLGGDSDSDVTLSGADSGINLAPSDSGLALDDASLDLTGAAAMGGGSSLDLSESFGAALTDDGDDSEILSAEVSGSEEFLLQPAGDDESGLEEDSSQIIALEEVAEEDDDVMMGEGVGFEAADDFSMSPAAAPAGAVGAVEEAQFGGLTIGMLACAVLSLGFCGVLCVDMIRTIWSWNEPTTLSSDILESLANLLNLR